MQYVTQGNPCLEQENAAEISALCQCIFSSLPRSDQRRWAEIYVWGLLSVSGKKTVKRISTELTTGNSEQCLQQFVNQSTWSSDIVRRDLALAITETLQPDYWVLEDAVIPKNGQHSVAVEKQFAHSEERTLNCQLGMGLFFSGADWSCPVNWRLSLPASWDADDQRRAKAHVPPAERHQPRWQYMLDLIDEVAAEWRMPLSPVIGDLGSERSIGPFLHGLEERGVPYAMKVLPSRPVPTMPGARETRTFGQLITAAVRKNSTAVNKWQASANRPGLNRILMVPIAPARGSVRQRHVAAEWSSVRNSPRSIWITSFAPADTRCLLEGTEQFLLTRSFMSTLYEDLGLRHFEGRSFAGWHHYSTLVSAAAACRLLASRRVRVAAHAAASAHLMGSLLDTRGSRITGTTPARQLVAL